MGKKVHYQGKEHEVLSSHDFADRKMHVLSGIGSVPASQCVDVPKKTTTSGKKAPAKTTEEAK